MTYPKYTSAVMHILIILNKSVLSQINSVTKRTVFLDVQICGLFETHTKVRWSSEKYDIINFVRQLNFRSEETQSYTPQQNNPAYYDICLSA
jgi:hypothetical protein